MFNNQSFEMNRFQVKDSKQVDCLLETLKIMIKPARINKSCHRISDPCVPVIIYGSRRSIMVTKIVIRAYNRLTPLKRHVVPLNMQRRFKMKKILTK